MKLDRLLAITMILINQRRVQAQELADMFDVSVRTIYRDIDSLNLAGIPIVTYQGQNGGIGLIDGFRMDKNLLTRDEIGAITTALKSVSTSYRDAHVTSVLEKIKGISNGQQPPETIFIDFSPWGGSPVLIEKVTMLKKAIESNVCVQFFYSNSSGKESNREVEPHTIVLKGQSWYLYAFCLQKEQFRLFKIARMKELNVLKKKFVRKEIQIDDSPWDKEWYHPERTTELTLSFNSSDLALMEEMFGVENVIKGEKDQLLVTIDMPEDEGMYRFLFSLMDRIEVMKPEHVRRKLKNLLQKMNDLYKEKG
ncbi:transcriptional regulator [Heyndrickxia sporothermodurans]|uniref:helix-turn-helix transcriptional regulator n=1 Tax=Heyndrickxia sporothermodurans TaxID=46224 RepID=UPI000D3ACF3C|nr:YafY family protein [Heyndrickxia sporothermodurans]PTY77852.1 transcriptional regulator [Heyndrickxia sporothermodurans]